MPQGPEAYSHMFSAALMQNGMNRFTSNGTWNESDFFLWS
jgi:hypothetical protein